MKIRFLFVAAALSVTALTGVAGDTGALRTLTTTGEGVVETRADRAVLHTQTTATSKSAGTAKQTVDQAINRALEALDGLKIEKDRIVASTIRISPEYQYENRDRVFSGYQANRDLRVTLEELDRLDKVLEALTNAGINNVASITLETSKEEQLREDALQRAIADSRQTAEILAKAYGAELGNIHTIHYGGNTPLPRNQADMVMARESADGSGGQYLHDRITIRDRINVVFELIIPH